MPSDAGTLTDTILQRVYDAGAVVTPRARVWDLLSRGQQIVNQAFKSIIVNLDFPTGPRQQVFTLDDIAPDILKVVSVRDQNRDLSEIQFNRLKHISAHWFGASGPRWETWARVGRSMIVVHPMKQQADLLTVVYTQVLPVLGGDADICQLPDDQLPTLTKLVEVLLLMRQRNFEAIKAIVELMIKDSQGEIAAEGKNETPAA
jgi:hypothetical protein